jgi:hypothetical protein
MDENTVHYSKASVVSRACYPDLFSTYDLLFSSVPTPPPSISSNDHLKEAG